MYNSGKPATKIINYVAVTFGKYETCMEQVQSRYFSFYLIKLYILGIFSYGAFFFCAVIIYVTPRLVLRRTILQFELIYCEC